MLYFIHQLNGANNHVKHLHLRQALASDHYHVTARNLYYANARFLERLVAE